MHLKLWLDETEKRDWLLLVKSVNPEAKAVVKNRFLSHKATSSPLPVL